MMLVAKQLSKMNRQPWLTADAADACRLPLHCRCRVQHTHLHLGSLGSMPETGSTVAPVP